MHLPPLLPPLDVKSARAFATAFASAWNALVPACPLLCPLGTRFFSLRFLSAYLLRQDIQAETHDSIEDARAALDLYKLYLRLLESGDLKAKIQEMYDWGRIHGYSPENVARKA